MEALLKRFDSPHPPYTCPHGRPTSLILGDSELQRRFGRLGAQGTG
jgi:DNA mismatch repair ATPase MutL